MTPAELKVIEAARHFALLQRSPIRGPGAHVIPQIEARRLATERVVGAIETLDRERRRERATGAA